MYIPYFGPHQISNRNIHAFYDLMTGLTEITTSRYSREYIYVFVHSMIAGTAGSGV